MDTNKEMLGVRKKLDDNADGKILSIGPGDDPLPCYYKKIIYLNSDSKVHVCNPREYY